MCWGNNYSTVREVSMLLDLRFYKRPNHMYWSMEPEIDCCFAIGIFSLIMSNEVPAIFVFKFFVLLTDVAEIYEEFSVTCLISTLKSDQIFFTNCNLFLSILRSCEPFWYVKISSRQKPTHGCSFCPLVCWVMIL